MGHLKIGRAPISFEPRLTNTDCNEQKSAVVILQQVVFSIILSMYYCYMSIRPRKKELAAYRAKLLINQAKAHLNTTLKINGQCHKTITQ